MNTLKEQNGRYYQEVGVVMLATNQNTNIISRPDDEILIWKHKGNEALTNKDKVFINLYFLSDDEIKKGDYVVETLTTGELEVFKIDTLNDIHNNGAQRKIIATTDESLNYLEGSNDTKLWIIPKPSDSFIKKYIEEYNAGKKIETVLVEYEGIEWLDKPLEYFLKVDSDNTITITKLKDSYSREEIKRMLEDAMYFGANWGGKLTSKISNNWIKENL